MLKILCGDNTFMRQQRLAEIKAKSSLQPLIVDANDLTVAGFRDLIWSQSLFSDIQFLIIYNLAANTEVWQAMIDCANQIQADQTIDLVLVEDKLDGRTKFGKSVLASGVAEDFKLPKEYDAVSAISFIQNQAEKMKLKIDASTARYLFNRVGSDPWDQYQALSILLVLQKTDLKTIEAYVPSHPMSNIFGVLELALRSQELLLKNQLDQLVEIGTEPQQFFGLLTSQLLNLLAIRAGEGIDNLATALEIHPYMFSKLRPLAQGQSMVKLKSVLAIFNETDLKLKSSQLESWDLIKICLYRVSALK